MLKYYREIRTGKQIYSIDMIRIKYDAGTKAQDLSDYIRHLSEYGEEIEVKYYANYGEFKYRHLWAFEDATEATWSIGMSLGNKIEEGYIEFNPNKCMGSPIFREFLEGFKRRTVTRSIVRWDLAIDIPLNRKQCILQKDQRKYQCILDKSKTEYLGRRNNAGFVKLYDKTAESELDYELTRLEITLSNEMDVRKAFPVVRIIDSQLTIPMMEDLGARDALLVQLLSQQENPNYYLQQLNYRQKKKIEPYLGTDTALGFDSKAYEKILLSMTDYICQLV